MQKRVFCSQMQKQVFSLLTICDLVHTDILLITLVSSDISCIFLNGCKVLCNVMVFHMQEVLKDSRANSFLSVCRQREYLNFQ